MAGLTVKLRSMSERISMLETQALAANDGIVGLEKRALELQGMRFAPPLLVVNRNETQQQPHRRIGRQSGR
jgi:hypothetical protein